MSELNGRLDEAARAGWLYYIAGKTQDDIARALNVSRPTAQRLVSLCRTEGLITFRINHSISECMSLAASLRDRHGLVHCDVVPSDGTDATSISCVAEAAAIVMERMLRDTDRACSGSARDARAASVARVGLYRGRCIASCRSWAPFPPMAPPAASMRRSAWPSSPARMHFRCRCRCTPSPWRSASAAGARPGAPHLRHGAGGGRVVLGPEPFRRGCRALSRRLHQSRRAPRADAAWRRGRESRLGIRPEGRILDQGRTRVSPACCRPQERPLAHLRAYGLDKAPLRGGAERTSSTASLPTRPGARAAVSCGA